VRPIGAFIATSEPAGHSRHAAARFFDHKAAIEMLIENI
jgi:hypothetical protein